MIRPIQPDNLNAVYEIVNDAAQAYQGIIPADRWHDPYMSLDELREQMQSGVQFYGYKQGDTLLGVMGIQDRQQVMLIRHAYVRTSHRQQGIGGQLLVHLCQLTDLPILVGTWAAAHWAIQFYQRNGFALVKPEATEGLLRQFWSIPDRQVATSVVLSNRGPDGLTD